MTKINIKGDVVDNMTGKFYSWFDLDSAYPQAVERTLADADDDLVVDIASPGGDVHAASEIYTMLRDYPGKVTVNVLGLAASAASVIAMAGDVINMSPTAQMMIHKAWTVTQGNADDLDHDSKMMDTVDQTIINAYEAKTGLKRDEIEKLMADETWMTAKDAVDKGFADKIMFADENQPQVVNAVHSIPSHAAINKFMTLMAKTEQPKPEEKPAPSVYDEKLAILLDKKEAQHGNQ